CCDPLCCGEFRSNRMSLFPRRFVPGPAPIAKSDKGPVISETPAGHHYMSLMKRPAPALPNPGQSKIRDMQYDKIRPKMSMRLSKNMPKVYLVFSLSSLHEKA
ncbi:hypothetical protein PoB_007245900, partial [Plakobranchus ocellatus]